MFAARRSEAAHLAMLHVWLAQPVDSRILEERESRDGKRVSECVRECATKQASNPLTLLMTLCIGSTMMTSKYLYIVSSLIQYELSTRRPPHLRPTRSSATLLKLRLNLSWVIPWWTGFP